MYESFYFYYICYMVPSKENDKDGVFQEGCKNMTKSPTFVLISYGMLKTTWEISSNFCGLCVTWLG